MGFEVNDLLLPDHCRGRQWSYDYGGRQDLPQEQRSGHSSKSLISLSHSCSVMQSLNIHYLSQSLSCAICRYSLYLSYSRSVGQLLNMHYLPQSLSHVISQYTLSLAQSCNLSIYYLSHSRSVVQSLDIHYLSPSC